MKKCILAAIVCCLMSVTAFAQSAIGIRGGYGWEVSYQNYLGNSTRAELDLGLGHGNGLNLAAIYQFVGNIDGGFNWYIGPGVDGFLGQWIGVGIGGQLGAEYNFDAIPFQISVDYRPIYMFEIHNGEAFAPFYGSWALAFRYTF